MRDRLFRRPIVASCLALALGWAAGARALPQATPPPADRQTSRIGAKVGSPGTELEFAL